jgi:hypothetical protein
MVDVGTLATGHAFTILIRDLPIFMALSPLALVLTKVFD